MTTPSRRIRPERMSEEDEFLRTLYRESSVSLDQLAYTEDFENIFHKFAGRFGRSDSDEARHEVLHRLFKLRKSGHLPRFRGSAESSPAEF
jgi:hypothetical protein